MKNRDFFSQMTILELRRICVAMNHGPLGFDYAKKNKAQMVDYAIGLNGAMGENDLQIETYYEEAKRDILEEMRQKYERDHGNNNSTPVIPSKTKAIKAIQTSTDNDVNVLALAEMLAKLATSQTASVDVNTVREIVKSELAGVTFPLRVEVSTNGAEPKNVPGLVHKQFPDLLKAVSCGVNVWLRGPAGSGKTTAAQQVAEALGLPFYFNGAIDNEYKLLGFTDAQGKIVSRPFRKAFIEGGVYLFDEVDASLPSALLAFNAALANGHCDFPDGCFEKHKDFRVIAAANTWGLGATSDYVGRSKMDAAFLDRFPAKFDWQYDEALERTLAGNDAWVSIVQTMRAKAQAKGVRVVISPRASIGGAKLIAGGFSVEQTKELTLRSGMTTEQWASVQ